MTLALLPSLLASSFGFMAKQNGQQLQPKLLYMEVPISEKENAFDGHISKTSDICLNYDLSHTQYHNWSSMLLELWEESAVSRVSSTKACGLSMGEE